MANEELVDLAYKQLESAEKALITEMTRVSYGFQDENRNRWIQAFHEQIEFRKKRLATDSSQTKLWKLVRYNDLLEDFTRNWVIYHTALGQRSDRVVSDPFMKLNIEVGDIIAHKLYEIVENKGLTLNAPDYKNLIVVPFVDRLYAGGFNSALPYIVAPRWASMQPWAWPGYAHEVGHHIYRNIAGFKDELKAKITTLLATEGKDFINLNLWFNWLEEIFADLFGFLQVGPAFIRTQQSGILLSLRRQSIKQLDRDSHPGEGLLRAQDDTHPIPYLRIFLNLHALEKLGGDTEYLIDRWENFFALDKGRVSNRRLYADVSQRDGKRVREKSFWANTLKETGKQVVELMLTMPMETLGGQGQASRSIKDVFYAEEQHKQAQKATDEFTTKLSADRASGLYNTSTSYLVNNVQDIGTIISIAVYAFEQMNIDQFNKFKDELYGRIRNEYASNL